MEMSCQYRSQKTSGAAKLVGSGNTTACCMHAPEVCALQSIQFLYADVQVPGFCDNETISTESGTTYYWPETPSGDVAIFTCPLNTEVVTTRNCSVEGVWLSFNEEACDGISEQLNKLNDSFTNVRLYNTIYKLS